MNTLDFDPTKLIKAFAHGDTARAARLLEVFENAKRRTRAGLPPSPPWPPPNCGTCGDAGWVISRDTRQAVPCGECRAMDSAQFEHAGSGIPWAQRTKTFETFSVRDAPRMEEALDWARVVADTEAPPWLVLWSQTRGNGKTHLAIAAGHVLRAKGRKVQFWYVPPLLDHLRAIFDPKSLVDMSQAMYELAQAPDWLILDDLGAQQTTPWVRERLEMLVDTRYSHKKGLIVTMNCAPGELRESLPRAYSRLQDKEICELVGCYGEDYRPKLKRGG